MQVQRNTPQSVLVGNMAKGRLLRLREVQEAVGIDVAPNFYPA
jgi:hypothetical protein